MNVIYRGPSCKKIFALCIVWKGECWWIWYLFQQLALSNYQMLWIQVHVLQSFSTAQDCTIDPFYPLWTALHNAFQFVSSVTVIFEGQVLLCVALMNHYFCTCFVHLIKKNMLCSSNAVCCLFSARNMQADNCDSLSAHGHFLTACSYRGRCTPAEGTHLRAALVKTYSKAF